MPSGTRKLPSERPNTNSYSCSWLGSCSDFVIQAIVALAPLLLLSACRDSPDSVLAAKTERAAKSQNAPPRYVGSTACFGCHDEVADAWTGSNHDWSLNHAEPSTLLGRFDGTSVSHQGESFRFTRAGERFFVDIDGHAGRDRFEVTHSVGVWPLQQVLLAHERGRLQALALAWDARPDAAGGQRWYPLQTGDDARPGAALHWAGAAYVWNSRCAACHSTAVDHGYDVATKSYATTNQGLDVGCEACHGPGSTHVRWAESGALGLDPMGPDPAELGSMPERRWVLAEDAAIARLEGPRNDGEVERCAGCHARRSELGPIEGFGPDPGFHDLYRLSLLERGLYFDDGQARDEVFVHGSFLQSKMHAAGVICSDCHEPHSLELRGRAQDPNSTCTSCHRTTLFDAPSHHFHAPGSGAARCVSCHMPARVYMGVDARHDHRFSVPRPLLSAQIGSPDPCLDCHVDRSPEWAAAAVDEHLGARPARWDFATALWLTREQQLGGTAVLADVVLRSEGPAIIRATALVELATHAPPSPVLLEQLRSGIVRAASSEDPLLRRAAASAARILGPGPHQRAILPLLNDPVRSVRIEAAASLLEFDNRAFAQSERHALGHALEEYRATLLYNADSAEALVELAGLDAATGHLEAAEAWFEQAHRIDSSFTAAYVNHADLLRVRGDDEGAVAILQAGLARAAEPAQIHHALGLALIRLGDDRGALVELARAHELAPDDPHLAYLHALALIEQNHVDAALQILRDVYERRPANVEVLAALASYSRQHADELRELLDSGWK